VPLPYLREDRRETGVMQIQAGDYRLMKKAGGGGHASGSENGFPCRQSVEGNGIRITAELPMIDEEMIQIDLDENVLTISVNGQGQRNRKEIDLPWEANLGKKVFRNGVLELHLERKPEIPHPD
jgi:HSP20 family molecular chaperone IbpA